MTRKVALAFGIGASLILAAGAARADCATDVHALQQQLGAMDIEDTSGTQIAPSTSTADTSTDTSATARPTAEPSDSKIDPQTNLPDMSEAPSDDTATDTTAMGTDTTTGTTTGTTIGDTSTSTDMSATTGPTTIPQDSKIDPLTDQPDVASGTSTDSTVGSPTVPSGTVGTGTVTETTRSGEMVEPADSRSAAIASLKKAQLYADAGQEEACMSELSTARQHMGVE